MFICKAIIRAIGGIAKLRSEEVHSFVLTIQSYIKILNVLVDKFLEFTRVDEGSFCLCLPVLLISRFHCFPQSLVDLYHRKKDSDPLAARLIGNKNVEPLLSNM